MSNVGSMGRRWDGHAPWPGLYRIRERAAGLPLRFAVYGAFVVTVIPLYLATNAFNAARAQRWMDPSTPLDTAIPVIGWSILFYVSYYLYHAAPIIAAPRGPRGDSEAVLAWQALWIITLIACAIFVIAPTDVHLRDQLPADLLAGQGWPGWMYGLLYAADTPWNAWPSLHVAHGTLIVLALDRHWWAARRAWAVAAWVALGLLVLSTLTTKQHFLFDVLTGAGLGAGTWWLWLRPRLAALAPSGWPT